MWHQYDGQVGKTKTMNSVATGNACFQHGSTHAKHFKTFMPWDKFCDFYQDKPKFKQIADSTDDDTEILAPEQGHVDKFYKQYLQTEHKVELVAEKQLVKALDRRTLPRHMLSVPEMQVPVIVENVETGLQELEHHSRFVFKSAASSSTASLITVEGVDVTQNLLRGAKFKGQQFAVADACLREQNDQNKNSVIIGDKQNLQTLAEFVGQRSNDKPDPNLQLHALAAMHQPH